MILRKLIDAKAEQKQFPRLKELLFDSAESSCQSSPRMANLSLIPKVCWVRVDYCDRILEMVKLLITDDDRAKIVQANEDYSKQLEPGLSYRIVMIQIRWRINQSLILPLRMPKVMVFVGLAMMSDRHARNLDAVKNCKRANIRSLWSPDSPVTAKCCHQITLLLTKSE